ncbi:MAG: hypothetical protein AB1489_03965 [Acidobacteriota bacterium]
MKKCIICHREYSDQFQFCSRDGTKLQLSSEIRYCPECPSVYPADIVRCPVHNRELTPCADPETLDANRCILCDEYYPPEVKNCPVHGIALKEFGNLVDLKSLLSQPLTDPFDDSQIAEVAEIGASHYQQVKNLTPAADTRKLEIPELKSMSKMGNLTRSRLAQYATTDRRLIAGVALLSIIIVVGIAAYGWSSATKQSDTNPLPFTSQPDEVSGEGFSADVIENEGEEIQRIDLGSTQNMPEPSLPDVTANQNDTINPAIETATEQPNGNTQKFDPERSVNYPTRASWSGTQPVHHKDSHTIQPNKVVSDPLPSLPPTSLENINSESGSIVNVAKEDEHNTNTVLPEPPSIKPTVLVDDTTKIAQTGRVRGSNISVSVMDKACAKGSKEFIYQFGLVLQENSGLKIKWQTIRGQKIALSGKSTAIKTVIKEQKANSITRYGMAVRMDGDTKFDWQGQLALTISGIDESGQQVEFDFVVPLDDSFPLHSKSPFGLRSFFGELYTRLWPF